MFKKDLPDEPPFWKDDPNPYWKPKPGQQTQTIRVSNPLAWISILWQLVMIVFVVLFAFQYPWLWLVVLYLSIAAALRYQMFRRQNKLVKEVAEIQQSAVTRIGASLLGSAIHTAGHPLIQAGQPVVLALKDDNLLIFSYLSSTPIDKISIKDIQFVDLVTYDDEGVPHIGVIENAAQALQLHFLWHGQTCTCLFRRMFKVRPVEWYHAIQAVRLA